MNLDGMNVGCVSCAQGCSWIMALLDYDTPKDGWRYGQCGLDLV